jgi:hypothetical protein
MVPVTDCFKKTGRLRISNTKIPRKWAVRAGPITWPSRSPDLTPFDLVVGGGGYIKDAMYIRTYIGYRKDKSCGNVSCIRLG